MVRLKKLVAAVVGLTFVGVAVSLFSPAAVQATQPPSTQNVNVVNTPLPVQGSVNVGNFPATTAVSGQVSIAGTPTVSISNTPAVSISGTPPVSISGTPNVMSYDAGQPQAVNGVCTSAVIALNRAACKPFTVPAGKRLVVEMISYRIVNDGATAPPYEVLAGQDAGFTTTVIGEPNTYAFPAATGSSAGNGITVSAETRTVRLYLDEQKALILQAEFGGANNYVQYFGFSGFLVDK